MSMNQQYVQQKFWLKLNALKNVLSSGESKDLLNQSIDR